MQWIVVEQVDDGGARLVALRLSDGARRLLFATEQPLPLHASVHPKAARVAVDVPSRGTQGGRPRTRVGLLNLERPGMGWLRQSLDPKWRVGHATFDDTGTRLALEGAWDGVPISDIYAYSVSFSGNSVREEPLGGAGNPARLGCRQVRFLEGGKQLIYLRKTQLEGGYEVCLLDLDRDGESAALLEGRAPSRLTLTLTEGAEAVPEVSMAWCGAIKQVFWVGLARGGTRQQVRTARVGVRPHTDLGPSHLRIEEICVARGGELLACSADGQVWLTDVESGASVAIVDGKQGVSHRGLCFDEAQGRLLFCTNDGQGSRLRALDLGTRSVRDLHTLGTASVVGLIALADEPEIAARMEGFVSVAEPAPPADDATAIQRVPPVGDEAEAPQLITEEIEAPPEDPTIELASAALEAALAAAPQPTPEPEPTPEPTPAPDPAVDFARWMKHIGTLDDPTKALTGLEKLRENSTLREAARLWLGTQRRRATGKEEVPVALLHALVAAGHLHLNEARGDLLELCRRGRPRVQDGGLLETDEHFALAALLYIDGHSTRFGWTKVYRDYEGMLVKINEVLEGEGEGPAARIMAAFAEGYERQIAGVLKAPDPTAVPGLDPKRLRESLAEMTAQAAVEASTRQVEDAPAAEEAEDQEALEAARLAEEARLAQAALQAEEDARRAEEEEEEIRALARRQAEEAERRAAERAAEEARREQARKAEEEARIEARRRAAIEAEKRKAEEDRLWHEQRRRAEQEAQQKAEEERLWQEQRRRAEQEAQQAEEERLWQEQRRRAEEARRPADASRRAVAKQSEPAERPASAAERRGNPPDSLTSSAADAWEEQRRRAEAQAQAEARQAEEAWQAQRLRAEEAARQEEDEERRAAERAADRARAEAATKVAAAERAAAEAEAALAAAEAADRLHQQVEERPSRRPSLEERPSRRPQGVEERPSRRPQSVVEERPSQRPQSVVEERPSRRPQPRFDERPAAADFPAADFPAPTAPRRPAADETADDLPTTGIFAIEESLGLPAAGAQGAPPLILPIAGLFAAASGLAAVVLGATRLGGLLPVLGALWLVAGGSLFADRRWAWLLGLGTFALNAIYLIFLGFQPLPEWLSGSLLAVWGVAAIGMGGALLHPNIQKRYGKGRRRF